MSPYFFVFPQDSILKKGHRKRIGKPVVLVELSKQWKKKEKIDRDLLLNKQFDNLENNLNCDDNNNYLNDLNNNNNNNKTVNIIPNNNSTNTLNILGNIPGTNNSGINGPGSGISGPGCGISGSSSPLISKCSPRLVPLDHVPSLPKN